MVATCLGGITVASKMCSLLLAPSASQSSFSSGVRPMPWLGQPCRFTGPFEKPVTSTRCSILPVRMSPTSNPSRSFTFTKQSVCAALMVNGRMELPNGPTVPTIVMRARDPQSDKVGE